MDKKLNVRGIDHIGITVPDMEQATEFFVNAFDAIYMYDIIDAPIGGAWIEEGLGVTVGTTIQDIRVLRLERGRRRVPVPVRAHPVGKHHRARHLLICSGLSLDDGTSKVDTGAHPMTSPRSRTTHT